jgi:hypothetical protein
MQCNCGGETVDRQFTRDGVLNKIKRCKSCGRQHVYAQVRAIEIDAENEADALAMAEYLAGDSFVSAEIIGVTHG